MAYSLKRSKEIKRMALEFGVSTTSEMLDVSEESIKRAIRTAEASFLAQEEPNLGGAIPKTRLKKKGRGSRVLVIGDIHAPFDLPSYFAHCCDVQDRYDCDEVVFIGDVIDNHFSSYHETSADGMGGGNELNQAKERLKRYYKRFPNATVIIGNHDRMIMRKAQTSAIPAAWIKEYKDVLNTPNWNFTNRVVIDGVQYIHGEGGTARTKSRKDLISTVQGHLHTQAYTEWTVGQRYKIFGCQVGCGVDHESYAMAYAKNFPKPAIGCAVIIDGKVCINELDSLGS